MSSRIFAKYSIATPDPMIALRRRWRHSLHPAAPLSAPRLRSGFETLRDLPLFAPVSDGELVKFAAMGFERRVEKGRIFVPGAGEKTIPLLALILEGEALLAWGRGVNESLVRPLQPGDWIGEIEMFSEHPSRHSEGSTADVVREPPPDRYEYGEAVTRARTTLRLMEWDRDDVLEALRRWPDVTLCLLSGMARQQRELQRRVAGLCNQPAPRRLARILSALAEDRGVVQRDATGRRLVVVRDPPPRIRLAELAGMARETVSRLLSDWERRGWIAAGQRGPGNRGGTLVLDAFRMRRLAGSEEG